MDYEKKYKEALERARCLYSQHSIEWCDKDIVTIFPELCESEDEKARKEIIGFIHDVYNKGSLVLSDEHKDKWIAWLEKQGGQKSTEWDEYDEMYVNALVAIVRKRVATDERLRDELIGWLSCLKCRLGE